MKFSTLLSVAIIISLFTACGPSYDDYYAEDYYYEDAAMYAEMYEDLTDEEIAELQAQMGEARPQQTAYNQQSGGYASQRKAAFRFGNNGGDGKVEMRPLIDSKTGRVSAYAPLPKNWKLGAKWESPGGSQVEYRYGGTASAQQRPINSIDQLLQQYLLPEFRKTGAQIDNIIDLPGIARNNERNYSRYWQAMPSQTIHQVKGIEVTDPNNGDKGLVIVNLMITQSQYGSFNNYSSNVMSAKANHYEQDKKTLIYALENMQLDDQAVAAHNQREQQKSGASWAAHNQRMRQKEANFNSWQQTQKTLSEINDISYEGYMNRSRMNDAGHQKTINGIWEQNTATNPYNGQQMNTSIHYKYNFVNQNGQVFGTNNPNYNPALDPNMNHMNWRKTQ
jgi:hypothetical protein